MDDSLAEGQRLANDIGCRLRWVREAMNLTTTELGATVGLTESTIRYIEKGKRGPSIQLVATLCHALRITPQYLFYGDVREINPELRVRLLDQHPELRWPSMPRPAGKRSSLRKNNAPQPSWEMSQP